MTPPATTPAKKRGCLSCCSTGCLTMIVVVVLMSLLGFGWTKWQAIPDTGQRVRDWFKSFTARKLPPSKTETLRQQWQQARTSLADAFNKVPQAASGEAGLALFKKLTAPGSGVFSEAQRIATEAAGTAENLRKEKDYYAVESNALQLPAEVRPELDQALAEHISALDHLKAEIDTLKRQLDSMNEQLEREAATCQVQAKLSGSEAARALWAEKSAQVIAQWPVK